jgi:hypothetical protein
MRTNHKIQLVLTMAVSLASSAVLAQEAAIFSNPVTCTTGACRAGYLATRTRSGVTCSAYGTHAVTISNNGETQRITAACSGGEFCFGQVIATVGGQEFYVDVDAEASGMSGNTTVPTRPCNGDCGGTGTTVSYNECMKTSVGGH